MAVSQGQMSGSMTATGEITRIGIGMSTTHLEVPDSEDEDPDQQILRKRKIGMISFYLERRKYNPSSGFLYCSSKQLGTNICVTFLPNVHLLTFVISKL